MHVEFRPARRVERLTDGGIRLEAVARGRIADREVVAVASSHAQRPEAAAHRLRHGAAIGDEPVAQLVPPERRALPAPEEEAAAGTAAAGIGIGTLELVHLRHDGRAVLAWLRPEEEETLATGPPGGAARAVQLLPELAEIASRGIGGRGGPVKRDKVGLHLGTPAPFRLGGNGQTQENYGCGP